MAIGLRNKLASFAIIAILITSVYATTAAPTPAFANHTRTCDTPDFFGYRCIDSNQVGGPVFSYIDISATGIPILPEVDDAVAINIPVGFDFNFYGTDYTTLAISSNGLTFTGPATTQFSNQPIGASTPSNFVAPFWDDLVTFGPGIIYYQTQGTAPTRTFIAQWHNVQGFSSSPSAASFQVILKESSPDILFQYLDVDFGNFRTNGADATVGIESPSGVGSQYSFNEASLSNDLAIVFTRSIAITHPLNGASLNTPSFTATGVAFHPSGIQSVEVEVDGTGFNPATGTDSWSYDVGTLSEGPHTITARQTANDQSTETAVSMFDIDLTPPNPTIIDPIPGQIITGNPYTMIGTSEAGAQVDIFDGPNQLGSTLADGSGMWSFDVFLTNGPHTLRVSSIDRAGNPSPSFFDVFVTVDIQIPPLLGATQFSGDLYGINPDTGAFSFLSTANVQLSGIDYSPDGTLYGARTELFTIEPISGVATQVGVVGTTCSDITFAGNLYCITPRASQLHIIDTTLGTYQLVGPTNIIAGSGGAIAARSDGVLFAGADTGLYTLDPATGLATQVAPWTNPPELEGQSCRPNAFEFDPIDRLFVSYNCGGGEGGGNHYLVTADTSTGILTFIGQTVPGLDAIAMRNQIPPIVNLKILKFNDHNANQIQDLGDEPLAGWHVTVTDNNGDVICEGDTRADDPNTPQDEAGTLECNGIDTADNEAPFSIQETLQPGFANTTPNPRVVFPFSPTLQVKIGNVLVSEIHGLKWNDLNGDGIRDQNEPGVSGVEICLYEEYDGGGGETELASSSSDPVCVTTMNDDPNTPQDEAGMYWILGLLPGFYEIYENVPPGTVQTFPQFGQSWFVTLLDGQIMEGIDFGNVAPGELRGNKWSDTNANGVRDAGEPPVSGVQIDLYKLTPPDNTGFFFTNTFTDVNGDYAFIGIPPGFYRIVEQPFGASQTFPPNGQPYFTSLVAGQIRTGLDFGNTQVPPGSITGTKWNDQNGNGLRDAGEPGVPGVQICLTPSFQCTFTDVNGDYRFDNIPAGVHNVQENIPFGAVNTTPIFLTVAVISAQTTSGVDFGNTAPTPPPPEITIGGLSSWQFGNLPVIYWGNPTTYTKNVGPAFFDHCGADQPTSITLVITFPETNGQRSRQMTQQGTSELWSTTFGPFLNPGDGSSHTDHGVASLRFDVFCPNGPLEIQQGGSVYIDPSGTIVDACTNNPIEAATVTILVESPPGTGNYIIAPAATPPLIPDTNPQTTLADGAYGWDVTPGNYIVRAEKANYITNESVVLAIPPPVTLLTIPLSPDADNDGIPDACIVDNLPDAVDDSDSTDEDTPVTTNVLANDSGLGDAPVIVSIETAAANGLATVNPDNSVRYVPNADFNGADSYSYRVTDVDGDSDTAQVFITVNPVNDGPTAPTPQNFQTNEDTTLNGQLVAEDVDGNTLTFSLNPVIQQIGPLKGTVTVNGDGTFTYIPNPNENGNDQFSALVSDGMVDSFFDVFIEIIPVNDPPTADNQNFQTNEDTPLNGQLVAGDPDFDLLRFAPETQPTKGTLVLNLDGSFTYTPDLNAGGPDQFRVRVSDGNQAVDSFFDVFIEIIPVNDPPTANDDTASTQEDTPVNIDVLANDFDPDTGDTKTITSFTQGASGDVSQNLDGTLRYVPQSDFTGTDSFEYTVQDNSGAQDSATVTVFVGAENDAPVADDDTYNTNEDTTLNVTAPGVLDGDIDVDSPTLTANLVSGTTHGTLALNSNGSFEYTPDPNYNGADSFTYQANDGTLNSNVATVSINVISVNDTPTADNQNFQTNEDTPLNGQLVAGDPDFDLLRFAPETQPTLGTLALNPDGSFTYSPNANENGQDTFQVRVSDGNQAVDSFFDVFFDIMPVNDSPTADPIPHLMVDEGQLVTFTVMGHDIDLPAQTLSYSLISGPLGASIDPLTGEFRWQTTEADGPGVYQIQIRVSDGAVDSFFDVFTEITVNELPDPVTYCDDRTLEQLLADASYNVIDNRDGHLGTKFKGTNGKDLILLSDAGNKVSARNGNDCMIGGAGNDDMQGNDGDDQIFGQGGKDKISGNKGNDKLNGGDDDDKLNGGKGNDMISGGAGKDKIQGHSGMDTITGDDGDDKIHGGKDADNISGGNGNDNIHGHQGADTLNGNDGDDKIQGGQGDDTIDGGAGTNKCNGGQGNNTITNCAPDNNMRDEDEEEEEAEDD